MESEQTREFFDAGLQSYGKALLAIYEFKGMLEDQLQNVMLAAASGVDAEARSRTRLRDLESCAAQHTPFSRRNPGTAGQRSRGRGRHPRAPRSRSLVVTALPTREQWPPVDAGVAGVPVGKAHHDTRGIPTAVSEHGQQRPISPASCRSQGRFSDVLRELLGHLDSACKKQQAALVALAASESR